MFLTCWFIRLSLHIWGLKTYRFRSFRGSLLNFIFLHKRFHSVFGLELILKTEVFSFTKCSWKIWNFFIDWFLFLFDALLCGLFEITSGTDTFLVEIHTLSETDDRFINSDFLSFWVPNCSSCVLRRDAPLWENLWVNVGLSLSFFWWTILFILVQNYHFLIFRQ